MFRDVIQDWISIIASRTDFPLPHRSENINPPNKKEKQKQIKNKSKKKKKNTEQKKAKLNAKTRQSF